jgi:hypothetical protein
MQPRPPHPHECGYDFTAIMEVMLLSVPRGASVGFSFYRPNENTDFNNFARAAKVANPAFLPIWVAEFVQFLLKW